MNRDQKAGMAVGVAASVIAHQKEYAETRKLLHDIGERFRYERNAAEAELTGPVLVPQVARNEVFAVNRRNYLRGHIEELGRLIKRIEFALADVQ